MSSSEISSVVSEVLKLLSSSPLVVLAQYKAAHYIFTLIKWNHNQLARAWHGIEKNEYEPSNWFEQNSTSFKWFVLLLTSSHFFWSSNSSWQDVRHSAWYAAANSFIIAFLLIMPITAFRADPRNHHITIQSQLTDPSPFSNQSVRIQFFPMRFETTVTAVN